MSLRGYLLALLAMTAGCDSTSKPSGPAPSRVQAVVAATSNGTHQAPSGSATLSAEPPKAKLPSKPRVPRPALCAGQLDGSSQPFRPKRPPERVKTTGADLPTDPIAGDGKRWTWVNLWAAWCVPCKQELPMLLQWQIALADDVHFAFVSLDDDERQLTAFLEDQGANGLQRSYWLPDGAARLAWLDALDLQSEPDLPMQILIDPEGRKRCTVRGAVEAEDRVALERIVAGK